MVIDNVLHGGLCPVCFSKMTSMNDKDMKEFKKRIGYRNGDKRSKI